MIAEAAHYWRRPSATTARMVPSTFATMPSFLHKDINIEDVSAKSSSTNNCKAPTTPVVAVEKFTD
jgi:hypothetical protein